MYFQGVPSSQTQRNKYGENALNLAVRAGLKGTRVFQQKKINLFEGFFQKHRVKVYVEMYINRSDDFSIIMQRDGSGRNCLQVERVCLIQFH